jgi:hypothetical protein
MRLTEDGSELIEVKSGKVLLELKESRGSLFQALTPICTTVSPHAVRTRARELNDSDFHPN